MFTINSMICTFMLFSAFCHAWTYLGMLQWFGDYDIPCGYNQNWYKAMHYYTSTNSTAMKTVDQRFNSLRCHILLSFEDFCVTGCKKKNSEWLFTMPQVTPFRQKWHFDGIVHERRNSSAIATELSPSCSNPSISAIIKKLRNCRFH